MEFKKYNHLVEEKKISEYWIKNSCFKPKKRKSNKKFSVVIPPPNITGRLHMGHALNNSLQDVLVREIPCPICLVEYAFDLWHDEYIISSRHNATWIPVLFGRYPQYQAHF